MKVIFGVHSRRYSVSSVPDLSGPSLVQARLYLPFTQTIAKAMVFAPAQRPNAPGRRDHPGYWCNLQADLIPTFRVTNWGSVNPPALAGKGCSPLPGGEGWGEGASNGR